MFRHCDTTQIDLSARQKTTLLSHIRFAHPGAAPTEVDPITYGSRALNSRSPPTASTRILRQSTIADARAPPRAIRPAPPAWKCVPEPVASKSFSASRTLAADRPPDAVLHIYEHPRLMTFILVPNLSDKARTRSPKGNKTRTPPPGRAESLSTTSEPSRRAHQINIASHQHSNLCSILRPMIGSCKADVNPLCKCRVGRSVEHKFECAAVPDPWIW